MQSLRRLPMPALRAAFIVILASGTTSAFAAQLTCESHRDGVEACSTVVPGSHVRFVRQLDGTPCVEGQSWGVDTKLNSIWISNGCRAVFEVQPPRNDPPPEQGQAQHA